MAIKKCVLAAAMQIIFLWTALNMNICLSYNAQDRTSVEEAKGEEWNRQMTAYDRIVEVCGVGFPLFWILPCHSRALPESRLYPDFLLQGLSWGHAARPPPYFRSGTTAPGGLPQRTTSTNRPAVATGVRTGAHDRSAARAGEMKPLASTAGHTDANSTDSDVT